MGFRLGAAKSLEKRGIPYIIWSEKELLNERKCEGLILSPFPKTKDDLHLQKSKLEGVTIVMALTEAAVVPASLIRHEWGLKRNSKSVINRCTDKLKMKEYLFEKNIPMAKFLSLRDQNAESIVANLKLPVVCKVKRSSGGRGVFFAKTQEEVERYLSHKNYFEEAVVGSEGSIESFIKDREIIFTNITQYYKNGECNLVPGHFDQKIKEEVLALNEKVLKALKLKWGMTHLEYYITKDGVLFGEVALRPPGGYIMEVLELSHGQSFWDVFIDIELLKESVEIRAQESYSAVIIFHPGSGTVKKIVGGEIPESLKSLVKFKLKLKEGDDIPLREGVGQDFGYLMLSHKNQEVIQKELDFFYENFKIEMY